MIASALRLAWGNTKGLIFRSVGENIFMAEFSCKRDRDHMSEGSPWHVSKHVLILMVFVEWMQPSELKFDKLQLWARVLNLPFNLRNDTWGNEMAKQIDPEASSVQLYPVGGYLRARATIDVTKPIRRWILIESSARNKRDWYDKQYEHVPNLCFSCCRLGHSDLFCPTPGTRDENGDLPFKMSLHAPDDRKRTGDTSPTYL